jgi:hypothetical protein
MKQPEEAAIVLKAEIVTLPKVIISVSQLKSIQ